MKDAKKRTIVFDLDGSLETPYFKEDDAEKVKAWMVPRHDESLVSCTLHERNSTIDVHGKLKVAEERHYELVSADEITRADLHSYCLTARG